MVDVIRYYADEHYPIQVTSGLRRRGIDVATAQEAGLSGSNDFEQLEYAMVQSRVILTFDSDFLVLHESGMQHAGIIWCPATKYSIGNLIQMLVLVHSVVTSTDMLKHVEYL
jgi:predicted nuclease of predicted toxin-antitoxin system